MLLGIEKHALRLKHEENGLFLKIHNENEAEKIEFCHFDVCNTNDVICAADRTGNIFIFNLNEKCYWQLTEVSIDNIKEIKFMPQGASKNYNLLIGNNSGFIYEIEINSGRTLRCIRAFSNEINQLLCSMNSTKTFVASTTNQIKIYEHDKFTKKSEFSFGNELRIKFVKCIPHDDKLFVILQNDTICILSVTNALKLVRHYKPLKEREKFLRKSNHKIEMLNYVRHQNDDDDDDDYVEDNDDKIIKSITRDYQNGIITDVSFHSNGNIFCVAFSDNNSIMLCSTMMWDVRRVIAYPDFYIKQCHFIPYPYHTNSNGANNNSNVLLTLTSNDDLMLTCMSDLNSRMLIDMNNVFRFILSANGRLLINLHHLGDLLVYNLENHLNSLCKRVVRDKTAKATANAFADEQQNYCRTGLVEIQMKMEQAMPKARLLKILKHYGEYPEKYRRIIWKALLKLPENCESFATLLRKDLHSSVSNYDKRFSLVDHKALNSLRHIMSCLAHWSKIFGNVRYLPKFVFPFVKHARGGGDSNDLLFCFEVVATLFLNHCQMWLEYVPTLQMPYNYLNLIENILMEMDNKLYEFYKSKDITSEHYAMPLMESAFSEVLDEHTWQQLWDHIVSNEPYFLLFIIVAYNSALRATIIKMNNAEDIKRLFFEQNHINFKKLMKKAYAFERKCSRAIHPKRYMTTFRPLSSNEYQKFEHCRGNLINANVTEMKALLREEQTNLDRKLTELETSEKSMEARMQSFLIDEEYQKRMKEIESKLARALDEEEQRIIYQRKLLLLNTKKAREREIEMIIQMKNARLQSKVEAGRSDLESMLQNIEKQRMREEIEMQMAEENLKLKEIALQMKAFNVESSGMHICMDDKYKDTVEKLTEQHKKFMKELNQLESLPSSTLLISNNHSESETNTTTTIASTTSYEGYQTDVDFVERNFHELEDECNRWLGKAERDDDYVRHMKELEEKMVKLEDEIKYLMRGLNVN